MKNVLLFSVLSFILTTSVQASIFYVDPNNGGSNGNTGLINAPWATIQQAASNAQAGDTVYVSTGTYAEKVTFTNSGIIDAPITFIGVGSVIVEEPANTTVWSGTFNINTKSYICIQNFTVQNSYWFGIYVEASDHIYLENNSTYNTGASGISVWHSSYVYAAHNVVRKACYQSLSTGSQECITFSGVSNFEIHHNEVSESGGSTNGGEGIDTKENCSYGKVYNNLVHDLIRLGIYADSWDKTLQHIDIYNNRVYKCSDGIAISSENGGTSTDVHVYNNLTYSNDGFGIIVSHFGTDGPKKNILIMNNTIYNNGFTDALPYWGGGIIIYSSNVENISIFNNIVSQNDAMQISDGSGVASVSINKNLIYGYRGRSGTNEVKGTNVIEADPLFLDENGADNISGNADDNLNVTLSSPVINQGTNTTAPAFDFDNYARPAEGTVDIGAYESNSIPLAIRHTTSNSLDIQLIQVYPNPSSNGEFYVKFNRQVERLEIIDVTGTIIQIFTVQTDALSKVCVPHSGIYIIRVYSGDMFQVYKIIHSN
ncbi:right-handed parallel beta-helix repeat-containing protein [Cytophaga aurantiaca]|uniref:right-handed parallel beta-helix repeat-containing protein n=1 Tax=Cytophaga aurantiaca TaxID=29530 RepID=UPI000360F692|nr:right-handed parallel beta-helix repeat-containing protein [Cytophaga aurantiaca]